MKSNFKYIVIGIICCLSIVFLFQLFWLNGLYNSIEEDTKQRIYDYIRESDQIELQLRLDSINNAPSEGKNRSIFISKAFSSLEDDDSDQIEDITRKQIINDKDTTNVINRKATNLTIKELDRILYDIKTEIHVIMDSIAPLNLHRLDSILNYTLKENNINAEVHSIKKIDYQKDSSMIVQQSLARNDGEVFLYKFSSTSDQGYIIETSPLTNSVLRQMSGILLSTFLIIFLLGISFWYLIKTIMQQKTLEQMKDDFTNNMTHELKTPIAVAYAAADALLNFKLGEDKGKRDKYLSICKEQLSDLTGRVEQILSMSMENRQTFILNKEEVQIDEMINNLTVHHQIKADKEVSFNIHIEPQDMTVYADRTHLNNMLSNLIDNAIKYSEEKVVISINVYRRDKYSVIEVKDNGIGIPSDKIPYIFDKFYRVTQGNKYNLKGYGLGLYYVKTLVEKHNGLLSVNSQKGKGSVFTIKIPFER